MGFHPGTGGTDRHGGDAAIMTMDDVGPAGFEVCVLGTFGFRAQGDRLPALAGGSQRLLALLSVRDRVMTRGAVAGTLWPEASEDHAHASLRSALGRLSRVAREAVVVTPLELVLADGVAVDLRAARALAHRLLASAASLDEADLGVDVVPTLSADVLPGWYEDWVLVEGEEWRQLRLHALESLADVLSSIGRYGEAASAAGAAVRVDPLRESARAAVMRVHLAEGNRSEALREFASYRDLLGTELGLEPTSRLQDLIDGLETP
jgi:DNA-binding SARP family transcriptional activator